MRCVNCEAEIPEGEKFCPNCGVPVGVTARCPHCGAPLLTGDRFCGECGRDVTAPPAAVEEAPPAAEPPVSPPPTPPSAKKRSPWVWILIAVGGLALLGCIIVCAVVAVPAMLATPTPTATPAPTATPTPSVQPVVLRLEEDFTAPSEGQWESSSTEDVSYALENGQYSILVSAEHWMAWDGVGDQFANFQVEFETTLVEGDKLNSSGIVFRYQDDKHFYSLDINGDGDYAVGKEVDGEWQQIVPWTAASSLHLAGEPNLVSLVAYGDRFVLSVNGEFVGEFVDGDYGSGDIALQVTAYDTPPARATFDNLKIWDVEIR